MAKVNVSELSGAALDYAVAIAKGIPAEDLKIPTHRMDSLFRYMRDDEGRLTGSYMTGPDLIFSRKWEAAGPIIEHAGITVGPTGFKAGKPVAWWAGLGVVGDEDVIGQAGRTALEAAMRCYVAYKLGDNVAIPAQLLKGAKA